jgi:hypothetical protein
MQVDLRILRFDPEHDAAPHWESYRVDAEPMDRVLNLLISVKADQDGTLTFRRSCAHGICGSDAMLINGRNRLACKIRVDQLGRKITVAPLTGLPVVKDLVVDMDGFFSRSTGSVMPFLIADTPRPSASDSRAPPTARARRHHQVHPVRRLHDVVPVVLGPALVRRPGRDRERPPVHLRQPRRRRRRAPGDPRRQGRRLALPDDLQLRRRLPARHQHHQGDPRGLASGGGAHGLSGGAAGGRPPADHPDRRRGAGEPGPGVRRGGPDRRGPARRGAAGRRADRHDLRGAGPPDQQRRRVDGRGPRARPRRRAGRGGGPAPAGLEAGRGADPGTLARQGREARPAARRGDRRAAPLPALERAACPAQRERDRGRAGQRGPGPRRGGGPALVVRRPPAAGRRGFRGKATQLGMDLETGGTRDGTGRAPVPAGSRSRPASTPATRARTRAGSSCGSWAAARARGSRGSPARVPSAPPPTRAIGATARPRCCRSGRCGSSSTAAQTSSGRRSRRACGGSTPCS